MKLRVAVLLLLALGVLAAPVPAQAAPCSGGAGVTVLVQFGDGPTQVGCASGDPDSGYAALTGAGFHLTYARGSGAGAICQINGYPALPNGCPSMPAAPNYWAYFHGTPGGRWEYSSVGGGSYDPAPGSVEGWCFGCSETQKPRTLPPRSTPPKSTPTARPTRKPSAKPSPSATTAIASATPTGSPTPTLVANPVASATPTRVPSVPVSSPTVFAEPGPVAGADQPAEKSGGLSWIWGVGLVAVLVAAGATTAVVRRRS